MESLAILPDSSSLVTVFLTTYASQGNQKEYKSEVNEEAVYASYNDENIYSELRKEICLVINIALAKGGPECIVKSYYSAMKCHQKSRPQSNKTLSLRTKLDWCLPNALNADRMVTEVSALYLNGDKEFKATCDASHQRQTWLQQQSKQSQIQGYHTCHKHVPSMPLKIRCY